MAISYFCPQCGAENTPGDTLCHACQHPLDAPPDVQESTALLNERYQILIEIGAGGFGAVYKARDTREHDRLVAVKQINLKGLTSQEIIEATDAFNREAQILSDLSHPLLPRIFDRFSDPEHWYLVMTFIEGSTLDDYLQQQAIRSLPARSGLSLAETLTIALQLCDALHYLHSQQPPVIFRDLKPGNIMRTAGGRLYLIDFGIARRFKPGQAKDTIPFGSPGFAAPEQYGKAQTTPQADIYSLGALLFCLISGDDPSEHPFQFPPLRLYGIDGIRELDALIQRMVALDPTRRPADIQDVQAELQRIQHIHAQSSKQPHIWTPPQGQTPPPTLATTSGSQQQIFLTPSSAQPPARKTSRRRVLTIGLLAGGAALVGGVIFLGNQQAQPLPVQSQPADQSGFDAGAATADAQNGEATATETSQIAAVPLIGPTYWSPDLSHAAVVNSSKSQIELYMVHRKQPTKTIQPDNFDPNMTVQWSANNSTVILLYSNGMIKAWDVRSGRTLFVSTLLTLALSPNGQYCAISYADNNNNANFILLQTTDGQKLFSTNSAKYACDCMDWSDDSRYLIFASANTPGDDYDNPWSAMIWDRETYQPVQTFGGSISNDYNGGGIQNILSVTWSPSHQKLAFISENAIWLSDLRKKQYTQVLSEDVYNMPIYGPVWSPDEKYLAALVDEGLTIWDTSNRQTIQFNGNGPQGTLAAFAWAADSKSITVVDNNNVISHWSVG